MASMMSFSQYYDREQGRSRRPIEMKDLTTSGHMHVQVCRLLSFADWGGQPGATTLAAAGFFCDHRNCLVCFSCKGELHPDGRCSSTLSILEHHKSERPQCDFANNRSTMNIPFVFRVSSASPAFLSAEDVAPVPHVETTQQKRPSGRWNVDSGLGNSLEVDVDCHNDNDSDISNDGAALGINRSNNYPQVALPMSDITEGKEPITSAAETISDHPSSSHALVGAALQLPSVSTGAATNATQGLLLRSSSQSRETLGNTETDSASVYPLVQTRPKHSQYNTLESRIRSYDLAPRWPIDHTHLAEAGFFYAGISDCVRCFHCSGGLRNWLEGDDGWEEHARWFSTCEFLIINKGSQFIERIRRQANTASANEADSTAAVTSADSREQTRSSQTSSSSGNLYNRPAIQAPPPSVRSPPSPSVQRARRLEEFMTGPIALTVLELGYSMDMIEQLVTHHFEMIGTVYQDSMELLDDIFRLEDETREQEQNSAQASRNEQTQSMQTPSVIAEGLSSVPSALEPTIQQPPSVRSNTATIQQNAASASEPQTSAVATSKKSSIQRPIETDGAADSEAMKAATASSVRSSGSFETQPKDSSAKKTSSSKKKKNKKKKAKKTALPDVDCRPAVDLTKLEELHKEYEVLRMENEDLKDARLCRFCCDEGISIVFLPCGHMCSCSNCAAALKDCPICRTYIRGTIKSPLEAGCNVV